MGQFSKIYRTFYPKNCQKYGFGIRDPEKTYSGSRIPDPGVKKAPDPGSGSATLHIGCVEILLLIVKLYECTVTKLICLAVSKTMASSIKSRTAITEYYR